MKEGYVKVVKKKKNTWILLISHKSCTGSIVREFYHLTVNVSIGLTCGSEYTCNKRLTLSHKYSLPYSHQKVLEISSFVKQTTSLKCKWFLEETILIFLINQISFGTLLLCFKYSDYISFTLTFENLSEKSINPNLWSKHFAMAFKS